MTMPAAALSPLAPVTDQGSAFEPLAMDDVPTLPAVDGEASQTLPGPSTVAPVAHAPGAPRRAVVSRDLAAWRVLKMWEPDATLAEATTVKLVGVHEGHSIVVTAPDEGTFPPLREGSHYWFRGFSGESIYEFKAPLLKACSEPFAYMHLGWPQERHVEKRERRAAARVKTELACMVYPGTNVGGRFVKGTITDLSTGGAAIVLSGDIAIFYDEITLVFRLTVADDEILVEARARPVRKPEDSGEKLMGVSFSKLGATERIALHAFIATAQVRELEVPLYAS